VGHLHIDMCTCYFIVYVLHHRRKPGYFLPVRSTVVGSVHAVASTPRDCRFVSHRRFNFLFIIFPSF